MVDYKLSTGTQGRQPQRRRIEHTRTRNGCERCRARRRKCDEGKPQCRRCTDAGVQCQYITHVFVCNYSSSSSNLETLPVPVSPHVLPRLTTSVDTLNAESLALNPRCSASDRRIHFLHHYNRCIAPWIDICDRSRTFGLLVPRLAMTSPAILDAMMQLSARSSRSSIGEPEISNSNPSVLNELGVVTQLAAIPYLLLMVSFVLQKVQNFIEAVPETWDTFFSRGNNTTSFVECSFDNTEYRRAWLVIGGLMSRLEIAYALVYETPPVLESGVLREALKTYRPSDSEVDGSFTTLDAYFQCITIVTDVLRLCFDPFDDTSIDSSMLTSRWSRGKQILQWAAILTELHSWHSKRPPEFQSLVEDENTGSKFPRVAFVDDAGASANMLYHIAMFILLTGEPTSQLRDGEQGRTETKRADLTPLWHARRVCGIGLTSDQLHWDPCMIAAFFLAARLMTNVDQQRDLLACLDRVGAAGWRIDGLVRKLREAWRRIVPPKE